MRRVFQFDDKGGLAGLIDADAIEHKWYVPIAAGLGYLYASADLMKRKEIEQFIEKYDFYLNMEMNFLIRFEEKEQEIDGYSINFDNGVEAIEAITEALSDLCEN